MSPGYLVLIANSVAMLGTFGLSYVFQSAAAKSFSAKSSRFPHAEHLQTMIDGIDYGVIVHGPDSEVLLYNQTAISLLRANPVGFLGRKEWELREMIDDQSEKLEVDQLPVMIALRTGQAVRKRIIGLHQNSTDDFIWLLVSAVPHFDAHGQIEYVIASFSDITKRKKAEAALQAERNLIASIMSTSVAAITVLDTKGKLIFANESAEAILGEPNEVLLQRSYQDSHWQASAIDGSPIDDHYLPFHRVMATGEAVYDVQHAIEWADGTHKYLSINSAPIKDPQGNIINVICLINDITARLKAEMSLAESEQRFSLVARATNNIIWDWDLRTGQIWPDGVAALLVQQPARTVPTIEWWYEQIHPEDRERVMKSLSSALQNGANSWSEEYRMRSVDGSYQTIAETCYILHENGRPVRVVGGMRDMTTQRQLEEQLRHAQKMEALGRLAGGIAHDFNNILTVILGCSSMLLNDLPSNDLSYHDALQVHDAASRAAKLTQQLLAVSRRQMLQPQDLDVTTIIASMSSMLQRLLGERIKISTDLAPNLPYIRGDTSQIEQVVLNLVVNARDAMPHGGSLALTTAVEVIEEQQIAALQLPSSGQYVVLCVKDTGEGMNAATRARIFEPFFTTKDLGKGTGLGLAMVHGIVAQSGGSIIVESEINQGSTFRVYLPVAKPASQPRAQTLLADAHRPSIATMLLIEESSTARPAVEPMLCQEGYRVLVASNGQQALHMLSEASDPIDLLIVNREQEHHQSHCALIYMALQQQPALRVLLVTSPGNSHSFNVEELPLNATILRKPFTAPQLMYAIQQALPPMYQRANGA